MPALDVQGSQQDREGRAAFLGVPSPSKSFTLADLATHNTKDDAWIAVDGKVRRGALSAA